MLNSVKQKMLSESILIIEHVLAYCVSELSITNAQSLLAVVYLSELRNGFQVLTYLQITWVLLEVAQCIYIALI